MADDANPASEAELRIRSLFDAGDLDGAMTALVDAYGGELFGFLVGLGRDRVYAEDAFGAACERMWKGLPKFRWESTVRVWAYTIARNEYMRGTRDLNRARQQVPLSEKLRSAIALVKSTSPAHKRSEVHERFARIREQLEPDDHILLGLRIDRDLSWPEIARVLAGEDDVDDIDRRAAALRKRYERLKSMLKKLVDEA
jgi:RNA polymerase sigma-70 factor (ECF subfamily)